MLRLDTSVLTYFLDYKTKAQRNKAPDTHLYYNNC